MSAILLQRSMLSHQIHRLGTQIADARVQHRRELIAQRETSFLTSFFQTKESSNSSRKYKQTKQKVDAPRPFILQMQMIVDKPESMKQEKHKATVVDGCSRVDNDDWGIEASLTNVLVNRLQRHGIILNVT